MLLKKISHLPKTDFILLYQPINRYWLTDFFSSDGLILIDQKKTIIQVFLDSRYYWEGKNKLTSCQVLPIEKFLSIWKNQKGTVTIEHDLPYYLVEKLQNYNKQLKFQSNNISNWRIIKNQTEIIKLKKICKITTQVWKKVVQFVNKNHKLSEKDVAVLIHKLFLAYGVSEMAFPPIVATDTNTAFIHTKPKETVLKNLLLCDFGGKLDGYCSDFSRTLILNSQSPIIPYFDFVKKIQKKIITQLKPGLSIKELVVYTNKLYQNAWNDPSLLCKEKAFFSPKIQKKPLKLLHALGHGIGLEVHEPPFISLDNDLILVPGMVLTIEPGVYIPELGGVRIEDVILITDTGYENLTS